MTATPIDQATGAAFALAGRVVAMDAAGTVLDHGVVYGQTGSIVDVRPTSAPAPDGFESVARVQTDGTVFPGLIELHNHLPYDVLQLWQVPKPYRDRNQWSGPGNPDYHRLITGPMQAIGSDPALVAAIVRYVELRCLLGGTTTSQGVTLANSKVSVSHFRGLVRNVENTGDPALPPATTHIADVESKDGAAFKQRISGTKKMILHLAEGYDTAAVNAFKALQLADGSWAITNNLIGIHCVALAEPDFATFGANGGAMVWSPLSNLLLYGRTANVGAAIAHSVPVALGSDWAPSGSKNLLGELKAARLSRSAASAPDLTDQQLVAMATSTPAAMLGWGLAIGSLEAGKRADLIVIPGTTGDPYTNLIDATEADLHLVMINGVPRVGAQTLLNALGVTTDLEPVTLGGHKRVLNLTDTTADPAVEQVSAAEAIARLTQALEQLPDIPMTTKAVASRAEPDTGAIRLAVAGLVDNQQSPRPHLPYHGEFTGPNLPETHTLTASHAAIAAAGPLPALPLDPLTAVDNPAFYDALATETNLPADVRSGLAAYHPA